MYVLSDLSRIYLRIILSAQSACHKIPEIPRSISLEEFNWEKLQPTLCNSTKRIAFWIF